MARDQIAASVLFALVLARVLTREPAPDDVDDRIAALLLAFVLVLCWRAVARLPRRGIASRLASDRLSADLRVPVAVIAWGLFALFAYAAAFG